MILKTLMNKGRRSKGINYHSIELDASSTALDVRQINHADSQY